MMEENPSTHCVPILHSQIINLIQQTRQLQQEKVDLEILLDTITDHAVTIEHELEAAQEELRRALKQERELNQRIEELAMLEERSRIARDIHDSLGHLLVGLNVQMETALVLWKDDPARAYSFLAKAKQLGSEALQATRESVSDLRADPLDGRSLTEAVTILIQEFHRTTGLQPTCQICILHPLPHRVNTVLYRIVQEGLTNICKHASATSVSISIQSTDVALVLTLQDNGNGFRVDAARTGFGLQGMKERIVDLGGDLTIASAPGTGCCITVSLQLLKRP
jgi:two-component system, sensor histidine kinase and response regulator